MTARNNRKAAAPAAAAPAAGIVGYTAEQAATLRTGVNAALAAGKAMAAAKGKVASAIDILIAGMNSPALLAHRFEFQARDRNGNVTETKQASLYDYAAKRAPFYVNGKEQRARITGFKAAVLAYAAGVNDASAPGAESAWSMIKGRALPVVVALTDNQIAAKLSGSKLALSGGNGTAPAKKLIEAAGVSTAKLIATVTAKGADSRPEQGKANDKANDAAAAAKADTLDIDAAIRAATAYLKKVAAGDEAVSNKRLSFVKAIAKVAADIVAQEAAAAAAAAK